MTARSPGRTAVVTPAFGMREFGGFGVRGFRAFCPECDWLDPPAPKVLTGFRAAEKRAGLHRCERQLDEATV